MGINEVSTKVNGTIFDWGDVTIKIAGERFEGITAIEYSQKRERTKVFGMTRSRAPIGTTSGRYNAEDGKISCNRHTAQDIRDHLSALAGSLSYGDVKFPIIVIMTRKDGATITDVLPGCWIAADGGGGDESSSDPLKEEIAFGCTGPITRNGKTLAASPI